MGSILPPNPVTLGARALMFGLDQIENARLDYPGFPPGTEPPPGQEAIMQEGGATQLPGLGSRGPSIYSTVGGGRNRVPGAGKTVGGGQGGRGGGGGGKK